MDKEELKNKIKEKLSEELKDFINLNFEDCRKDIEKSIEDFIRENLPKEPPLKNVTSKINEKGDGVIIEFELNPSYRFLFEEI